MDSMRALVIRGAKDARVEYEAQPVPKPGEALIDVHRVGVCGTDLELFTGELAYFAEGAAAFPLRPGHEWCGRVSAVGSARDQHWEGRRVVGDTMLPCGHCTLCRLGRGHVCPNRFEIGIRRGWPGALAERFVVPVSCLHALPDSVDDEAGALVEPGANAWRAATAAGARPDTRVLVLGPGTIGLLTAAFAAAAGAQVHLLGLDRSREQLAAGFGVRGFWTVDEPADPGFDAVIDCTDDPRAPAMAADLVLPGGRLVFIGVATVPSVLDVRTLIFKDVTAVGVLSGSPGLAPTIEAYAHRQVSPGALVGCTVALEDAPKVFEGKIQARQGTKIHIDPRRGAGL